MNSTSLLGFSFAVGLLKPTSTRQEVPQGHGMDHCLRQDAERPFGRSCRHGIELECLALHSPVRVTPAAEAKGALTKPKEENRRGCAGQG